MKNEIKCYSCHRENVPCVVFVNAKADLSSICTMCLTQAMRQALKEVAKTSGEKEDE